AYGEAQAGLDHVRRADRQGGRAGARRAARARGLRPAARRGWGLARPMGVYVDTALAHEFPTLARDGLAYLDSSATSQTPRSVLDAMADYYERHRASVHRGTYPLAVEATDLYEHGRLRAAQLVGGDPRTTILVRNATEAINLVAYSWG